MLGWFAGEPTGSWNPLGAEHVVADTEGDTLFNVNGNLDFCKTICSNYQGCKNFAYCDGVCFLKDGEVNVSTPRHNNTFCTTYFWSSKTVTTTLEPARIEEPVCRSFNSDLSMNQLQQYDGNPEAETRGSVDIFMCTNGTVTASLVLHDGRSELIATLIHHCSGGSTPQKRTGVMCTGPPVVNFCGHDAVGLIDDGTSYTGLCSGYDIGTGISNNLGMPGKLVPSLGLTVMGLVTDMIENPNSYYFNVHSLASYNQWHPDFRGVCRGVIELNSAPVATTTLAPMDPDDADKCYDLYSKLAMNELQEYHDNVDASASGYASFTLCANGTLSATVLVFGGVSEVIAMGIHRCHGGDTPMTKTAEMCQGPPVIAFCGENANGYLNYGVQYTEACAKYSGLGASITEGVEGTVVPNEQGETNTGELVLDIVRNPHMYFFNVHSLDSYGFWYPRDIGMCRGSMNIVQPSSFDEP